MTVVHVEGLVRFSGHVLLEDLWDQSLRDLMDDEAQIDWDDPEALVVVTE